MSGWILTFTGRRFYPCDPNPDDIHIVDIAHALSMQCRFTGHSRAFYSVAQHSAHVSEQVPQEHALWGLLHDAAEAYLVDLARPVKQLPEFDAYREAERRVMRAVCKRFGLPETQPDCVTDADHRMLVTEARDLMHPNWQTLTNHTTGGYTQRIVPRFPTVARRLFLDRFEALT